MIFWPAMAGGLLTMVFMNGADVTGALFGIALLILATVRFWASYKAATAAQLAKYQPVSRDGRAGPE